MSITLRMHGRNTTLPASTQPVLSAKDLAPGVTVRHVSTGFCLARVQEARNLGSGRGQMLRAHVLARQKGTPGAIRCEVNAPHSASVRVG
eukprot:3453019-Rhodomonas_salina.1